MKTRTWLWIIFGLVIGIVANFTGHFWSVWLGYIIGASHMIAIDIVEYKAKVDSTPVE